VQHPSVGVGGPKRIYQRVEAKSLLPNDGPCPERD
jgi:hypothetical protein